MRRVAVLACALLAVVPGAAAKDEGPTSIAVGAGAAWVASGDGTLTRLDATGRLVSRIRVGGYLADVTVVGRHVWVASYGRGIADVDVQTSRVRMLACCGLQPFELAAAGSFLWVFSSDRKAIVRIDGRTGRVTGTRVLRHFGFVGPLAADADSAWVGARQAGGASYLVHVGGRPLRVLGRPMRLRGPPVAIAVVAGMLWVSVDDPFELWRVDPRSPQRRQRLLRFHVAPPGRVVSDREVVWAVVPGRFLRLDPRSGRVLTRVRSGVQSIALGDGVLWGASYDGTIVRLDAGSGRSLGITRLR